MHEERDVILALKESNYRVWTRTFSPADSNEPFSKARISVKCGTGRNRVNSIFLCIQLIKQIFTLQDTQTDLKQSSIEMKKKTTFRRILLPPSSKHINRHHRLSRCYPPDAKSSKRGEQPYFFHRSVESIRTSKLPL